MIYQFPLPGEGRGPFINRETEEWAPTFVGARKNLKTRRGWRSSIHHHAAARGDRVEAVENAEDHGVHDVDVEEIIDDRDQRQNHPEHDMLAERAGDEAVADR